MSKITKDFLLLFANYVIDQTGGAVGQLSDEDIELKIDEFLDHYSAVYKLADDDNSSGSSPSPPGSPRPRPLKRRSSSESSDEGRKRARRDDRSRFISSDSDDSDDSDNRPLRPARPAGTRVLVSDSDSDESNRAQPTSDVEPDDDDEQGSDGGQSSADSAPESPLVEDSWGDRIVTRSMRRQQLAQEARRAARAAQTGGRATVQAAARGQSGAASGAAGSGAAGSGAGGSGVRQPAAVNQPAPPVGPTCYHCGISLIVDGSQPQRPGLCVLCGRYRPRGQTGANRQPLAVDWSGRLISERPPATIEAYVTRQTREHGGVQPQQVYTGT